jgi:hypothetical protein
MLDGLLAALYTLILVTTARAVLSLPGTRSRLRDIQQQWQTARLTPDNVEQTMRQAMEFA